MSPRPYFLILLLAVLAACSSGTVRPADDTGAVAPAPSPAPSTPVVDPDPAPLPAPAPEAPGAAVTPPADNAGGTVEIRRIGSWVSSGVKGSRRLVIRDPDTWNRFWSELGAGVRPEVDFSRDLVIAVASGERRSGGHEIAVERVSRTGGELRIEVVETGPGAGCVTTAALTQPVDVVLVSVTGVTGWSFADPAEPYLPAQGADGRPACHPGRLRTRGGGSLGAGMMRVKY
jgi:PrcB C-terminal